MGNTYSQVTIHAVFTVKYRHNLITKEWREELHKYISGIITNTGGKSLAVGGWLDHVHVFFGLPVTQSISEMMCKIKANSSRWVNENNFVPGKFQWQEGYGAFAYAKSQRSSVISYIQNQEQQLLKKRSEKNTLKCYMNMKLNMMKNIYSISLNKSVL